MRGRAGALHRTSAAAHLSATAVGVGCTDHDVRGAVSRSSAAAAVRFCSAQLLQPRRSILGGLVQRDRARGGHHSCWPGDQKNFELAAPRAQALQPRPRIAGGMAGQIVGQTLWRGAGDTRHRPNRRHPRPSAAGAGSATAAAAVLLAVVLQLGGSSSSLAAAAATAGITSDSDVLLWQGFHHQWLNKVSGGADPAARDPHHTSTHSPPNTPHPHLLAHPHGHACRFWALKRPIVSAQPCRGSPTNASTRQQATSQPSTMSASP